MIATCPRRKRAMPDRFTALPLHPSRIDQAYPVVVTSLPGLTIDVWRTYAHSMLSPPKSRSDVPPAAAGEWQTAAHPTGGLTVVQTDIRCIHGLFAWLALPSVRHQRVLQLDLFVALDMFDSPCTAEAMLREANRLAHLQDCSAIHLSLPHTLPGAQARRIAELGYFTQGMRACRHLSPAGHA